MEQGFTFDMRLTGNVADDILAMERCERKPCQLVELNIFALLSGRGGALYHWIKDYKILYKSERRGDIDVRFSHK